MPTNLPIACSLSAAEMPARLAEMAAIGRTALLSVEPGGLSTTLHFRAKETISERLEAIIAAEGECCAFLELTLRHEPETVTLTITAPAGAELVVDELVTALTNQAQAA